MSGVFRDVTIEWEGEEYTFTPSNRLLRSIESGGVNILSMIEGLATGSVSAPSLAYVAAAFLRAGGAKVTEDDAYLHIMGMQHGEDIESLARAVKEAITPMEADEKKPAARSTTKPRAKPKPRARAPAK